MIEANNGIEKLREHNRDARAALAGLIRAIDDIERHPFVGSLPDELCGVRRCAQDAQNSVMGCESYFEDLERRANGHAEAAPSGEGDFKPAPPPPTEALWLPKT